MCRMTIYKGLGIDQSILLSDLITRPNHSIIKQSYNCQERFHNTGLPPQLNADGFGIGWYVESLYSAQDKFPSPAIKKRKVLSRRPGRRPSKIEQNRNKQYETPCVFTSVTPAWNNRNLFQLADKVKSPLFFGHVRAASIGSPTTEANCHPFTYDKYLWMHNGGISDFHLVKRKIVSQLSDEAFNMMRGNTDSEHIFALFLTVLGEMENTPNMDTANEEPHIQMKNALLETITRINDMCREALITKPSLLNFAITDGKTLIATRYANVSTSGSPSLYFSSGSKWVKSVLNPGEYIMQRQNNLEKVFIMASERLSVDASDWVEVRKNCIITVTKDMNIQFSEIKEFLDVNRELKSSSF